MLALLLSTEFLFQPFVWRNYAPPEIGWAWLGILRDRLVVAMTLAAAVSLGGSRRAPAPSARIRLQLVALIVGATVGELLLSRLSPDRDRQDFASLVGRILRWVLAGGAAAVILEVWRSAASTAMAAYEVRMQEAQVRRLAASSQLEALRRQIEPHFLFNILATIRRLQRTDPEQGRQVLARLLQYMSAALAERSGSSLGEELALVRAYLEVCASRMSGGLIVETQVDETLLGMPFPSLVLATLAENAMKHGVFPQTRGNITLSAERVGGQVEVVVADDGVGLSDALGEGGGGLGLANTVERLRLMYGREASLQLQPNTPRGVRACVRVPAPGL